MIAIKNVTLVLRDHFVEDAVLFMDGKKIHSFGEMWNTKIPKGMKTIDGKGLYLMPGFVDIHTHAYCGEWFYNDPIKVANDALKCGTTTVLPTLYFDTPRDELVKQIDKVKKARKVAKNIGGLYMEAPYMNPKFGCNRESNPWRNPIKKEEYMPLLKHAGKDVRVWVIAPERKNIEAFVKDAKKENPDVRFAVGHSEASPAEIEKLVPYGLCLGTHHTNATGTLPKYPECRGVCVDEVVAYRNDLYAEIISDSRGIHVDPYYQRLIRKYKGDDKVVLISDACVFDGPIPPGYENVKDICFDFEGEIAGSKLTLAIACHNFMKHTGASLVEASKMACLNPATAVGFTDRGEIAVGKRADLLLVDGKVNVKKVIFEGEVVE